MSSVAQSRPLGANQLAVEASPLLTVRLLRALGNLAEGHGWLLFVAISLAWGIGLLGNNLVTRHLDHDELFTFYIAQAPNLAQSIKISQTVDLQPPLSYLLVRASFAIFGVSAWSCRLPFLLAYACSAALMFYFVRHLVSPLFGLISTLLLWSTPYTSLATEARPYALLLCFTVLTLVTWYRTIEQDRPGRVRARLAALAFAGFCLLLTHVFGILVYGVVLGAEIIRQWVQRKSDWRVWMALLAPLLAVVTYLPLFRNHSTMMFAEEYRVTPLALLAFYWESVRFLILPLASIVVLGLLYPVFRKEPLAVPPQHPLATRVSLTFLLASFSLLPIAIAILLARDHTAFFNRYGIVWLVPFCVGPAVFLGYRTRRNQIAGTLTVVTLAVVFFFNTSGKPWLIGQVSNLLPAKAAAKLLYVLALPPIQSVQCPAIPAPLLATLSTAPFVSHLGSVVPGVPLVANTALTFLELDHQEGPEVAQRLYLLTDQQAASTIAHDTVFSHYEKVKAAFPMIRGSVESYCAFTSAHPHFVVVGAYNNPQGWVLRKLHQDGAQLRAIGTCQNNTEDCQIYDVVVQNNRCAKTSPLE